MKPRVKPISGEMYKEENMLYYIGFSYPVYLQVTSAKLTLSQQWPKGLSAGLTDTLHHIAINYNQKLNLKMIWLRS